MNPLARRLIPSPRFLIVPLALALGAAARAQGPTVKSPEVNPDQSVTIRYYGPGVREVTVSLDYDHHTFPLKKGEDGTWSYTTPPLEAAVHMYSLTVDGLPVLDPLNPSVDRNFVFLTNDVRVRKPTPQPWDVTDVPHGVIHHHEYRSRAILGLADGLEDFYVYTPPGYDGSDTKRYPVLYLLHGWSSMADSWIAGGQANLIFDNLIAKGDAVPMVVVMPLGYGDISFVLNGFDQWNDGKKIGNNLARFSSALLSEILPQVEKAYRVRTDRAARAIAGLSMGGGESLIIGLSHPEVFSWIGGFSSAINYANFESVLPSLDPHLAPRLLWIACGTSDDLVDPNRRFVTWIKTKGFEPTAIETPGIHNWPVWRDNLVHFAPLLFRAN
ncbi:MAG TPA: alpha/beta hydrolase-fold protein [Opitutaceae bacterium]